MHFDPCQFHYLAKYAFLARANLTIQLNMHFSACQFDYLAKNAF